MLHETEARLRCSNVRRVRFVLTAGFVGLLLILVHCVPSHAQVKPTPTPTKKPTPTATREADANRHQEADANCHPKANANCHQEADANGHPKADADTHEDASADGYGSRAGP